MAVIPSAYIKVIIYEEVHPVDLVSSLNISLRSSNFYFILCAGPARSPYPAIAGGGVPLAAPRHSHRQQGAGSPWRHLSRPRPAQHCHRRQEQGATDVNTTH